MKKSILDALSECRLFNGVASSDITQIAENYASVSTAEKNSVIFSEKNYERALVIIVKGKASVTKSTSGSKILMSMLKKGDIFGMAALFYEQDNFLTCITAEEKVTMVIISKESLKDIFREYPIVAENYITILSERIHFLNKKISTYTKPETIQKVASFILQYTDTATLTATLPYSITSVAEALNTGRASVYRAFDTLAEQSIIRRDGRKIRILDIDSLKDV